MRQTHTERQGKLLRLHIAHDGEQLELLERAFPEDVVVRRFKNLYGLRVDVLVDWTRHEELTFREYERYAEWFEMGVRCRLGPKGVMIRV